jgi:hypothetical protein
MTPETVECPNCGRSNPAWAQVCRTCGYALGRRGSAREEPTSRVPIDQASLLSIGGAVGSIVLAIALGLGFSAMNPTPPGVLSSATPSATSVATPSTRPSASANGSARATASPTPKPLGTITFGTGLNHTTRQVVNPTTSFGPDAFFAHSVTTPQPFGVATLVEEVLRVTNGKETAVQLRTADSSRISVSPTAKVFGFIVTTNSLLTDWHGGGVFIIRVWRGDQKLAEGRFTLTAG